MSSPHHGILKSHTKSKVESCCVYPPSLHTRLLNPFHGHAEYGYSDKHSADAQLYVAQSLEHHVNVTVVMGVSSTPNTLSPPVLL